MRTASYNLTAFLGALALMGNILAATRNNDPSDSLCRQYNRLVHELTYVKPDSAMFYARKMFETGLQWNNQKAMAAGLNRMGILFRNQGRYERALSALDSSLQFFTALNDSTWIAHTILMVGSVYEEMGEYEQQIRYLLRSLQRFEDLHDPISVNSRAHVKNHIGTAYFFLDDLDNALKYYEAAYRDFLALNDSSNILGPVNNLGMIYKKKGNLDLALKYYKRAYDLNERVTHNPVHRGQILNNIGDLLGEQGKYAEALDHHQRAFAIATELDQTAERTQALLGMGSAELGLRDLSSAMAHADSAMEISKRIGAKDRVLGAMELKVKVLKAQGRFKEMAVVYDAIITLRDSIINEEKARAIAELEVKFDTEQKEKQILLKEQALLRAENEREEARFNTYLLALGLAMVLLAAIAIVISYRSRMRANRLQVSLVETELEASKLREEKVTVELEESRKSLTSYSLILAQRNEMLQEIKSKLEGAMRSTPTVGHEVVRPLISGINSSIAFDNDWEEFRLRFEKVHSGFFKKLEELHPELTSNEHRLFALLKLNLSRKQIASLLNISPKGVEVAQYRIRKKLSLDANQDLTSFAASI